MNSRSQFLLIVLCGALAFSVPALSEEERPGIPHASIQPTMIVDWAGFRGEVEGESRLEVYYQIFNFGLQFVKQGDEYVAEYELTAIILDDKGDQVKTVEQGKTFRVASVEQTKSRFDYRTSQLNFQLDYGTYRLHTSLKDKQGNSVFVNDADIKLASFRGSSPGLSDIEFVQAATSSADSANLFFKTNLAVIPSVSRMYGGADTSRLLCYVEIYPGSDSTARLIMETIIRSRTRGIVYRDTQHVSPGGEPVRQLRNISVGEFGPGDYDLEVYLRTLRNKKLDERREPITIVWTQEGLLRHDFRVALDQLGYVATSSEVDKIRKLKTLEERIAAFDAFWLARDPTTGTRENEMKREFYRRVFYANREFRHMRTEGWRSDRGRIYIMYGEPDEIDDVPMSPSAVPYQIWHYYKQGQYKRFAFVDRNDDGDYRLQYPYDGLNQRPDF